MMNYRIASAAANRGKVKGATAFASGGGSGLSADESGNTGLRIGLNLAGINYFNGSNYFIDKMKQTQELWSSLPRTSPVLDSNHFPAALANGTNVAIPIWNNLQDLRQTQKMKSGTWKITWDATGGGGCLVDLVLIDGITTSAASSSGTFTFTVTDGTTASCWLRVQNLTGSNGRGVTNVKIFHTDHEALLNAGEVFDPDFIDYLTQFQYMRFVRFLDWQSGNLGNQTSAADLMPMSYQSWCTEEKGCPPELIGLLAKKLREELGRDVTMWTVMPRQANAEYMTAFFTRIYNTDPTGTWPLRVEGINEAWNGGFPAFAYLISTYYTNFNLTGTAVDENNSSSTADNDRMTKAYIHHAMRTWTAADAVFGSSRVIPIVAVQTGFYALMASWIHQRDTTSALYSGATALSIINARGRLAFTMYYNLYSLGTTQKTHLINDIGASSEASIEALFKSSIDDVSNNQLSTSISSYRLRGVTCRMTMYEGNNHDFWDKHSNLTGGVASFNGTCNTGTNIITMADGTAWITNGDLLLSPNQNAVQGTTFPYFFYVRKTGSDGIRCYLTQVAYAADSGNTGAGAAALNAGTYYFAPQTRFARWSDKLNAIMIGATNTSVYTYAVNKLSAASINLDSFAIFALGSGSARLGTGRFTYCFDNQNIGLYGGLTPSMAYLATLSGL